MTVLSDPGRFCIITISHSKSAKSTAATVLYGIVSSENSYPHTGTATYFSYNKDCTNECSCGKIFIYMLPVAGEVGKERLRPDLTGSGNMKGEQDEQL